MGRLRNAAKVLVVARPDVTGTMAQDLSRRRYAVRSVVSGAQALREHGDADLVIVGLRLSDMDGIELCRSLRSRGTAGIIAFSEHNDELDRVLALKAGADDCVAGSCGPHELLARVEAVLRRVRPDPAVPEVIELPPLHLDRGRRAARLHGVAIDVTSKEFDLLFTLAAQPGTVVSRKELMARVWGDGWASTSRTIDTHVSSLRAKLGCGEWILTVRGVGYQLGRGC